MVKPNLRRYSPQGVNHLAAQRSQDNLSSEGAIPRRPPLFRALGKEDPPPLIHIHDDGYRLIATLKHDSWAATARYESERGHPIACKFNRASPLPLGVPAAWIGTFLARREERVFRLMAGQAGFPKWSGPVMVKGLELPNAVAHDWIDGDPFHPAMSVGEAFFPTLRDMLKALHAHDIAYVDMSKWGNILVGRDGHPYLIDYQIHFRPRPHWPLGWLLGLGQAADLYYFHRHWLRCRPDQHSADDRQTWSRQPWPVWIAEKAGPAFRRLRLFILGLHRVRGDPRRREAAQKPLGILEPQPTDAQQDAKPSTPANHVKVLTWKDRAIIALVAPLGRALIASLRVKLTDSHHFTQLMDAGQPCIFVVWHCQLLLAVKTTAEWGIVTLASPTRDGQIGAEVARRLGIESVTGDSRYQSLAALRLLARHLREGRSLGLFPDGPAGPARRMKPGPLVLARLGGCPLVPAGGFAPWSLRLPSHWDHFILPLPFSRVIGVLGEPLWVPQDTSPGDLEILARELEMRLQALEQRAHDLNARRPALP